METHYKFGERSLRNLKNIHPNLVKVLTEAIKQSPVDFTITDGIRTIAEQQALYAKGRTAKGAVVTNADGVRNKSNHQPKADGYGYAVDLYPYYKGSVLLNDILKLRTIAQYIKNVAKQLGIAIEWGGDWKFKDFPHFQLKN